MIKQQTSISAEVQMYAEEQRWLTVKETSELLRIPLTRCYELIQQGALPAVRIGERSLRVNRDELERFLLESRRVAEQA